MSKKELQQLLAQVIAEEETCAQKLVEISARRRSVELRLNSHSYAKTPTNTQSVDQAFAKPFQKEILPTPDNNRLLVWVRSSKHDFTTAEAADATGLTRKQVAQVLYAWHCQGVYVMMPTIGIWRRR